MLSEIVFLLKLLKRVFNAFYIKWKWKALGNNLGRNILFGKSVNLGGKVYIGSHSYIGQFSYIGPNTKVGQFCIFSDNVNVIGSDHEINSTLTPIILSGRPSIQPETVIYDDVWLGHGVVVMRGVSIGQGSIVGANSVVTKNIEPYSIYAGVPAKKIKDRFNDETDMIAHRQMLECHKKESETLSISKFIV